MFAPISAASSLGLTLPAYPFFLLAGPLLALRVLAVSYQGFGLQDLIIALTLAGFGASFAEGFAVSILFHAARILAGLPGAALLRGLPLGQRR